MIINISFSTAGSAQTVPLLIRLRRIVLVSHNDLLFQNVKLSLICKMKLHGLKLPNVNIRSWSREHRTITRGQKKSIWTIGFIFSPSSCILAQVLIRI